VGQIAGISLVIGQLTLVYLQSLPQLLPISKKLAYNNQTFYLEFATKPEELVKGLKFRSQLPKDCGMLFNLGKEYKKVPFWMFNVKIPLDIIYIQNGLVTTVIKNAPPCKKDCPIYYGISATEVLELGANTSNIKVGDRLTFTNIQNRGQGVGSREQGEKSIQKLNTEKHSRKLFLPALMRQLS
jgi:uncharacterized membrane protein (UPF0127 family)